MVASGVSVRLGSPLLRGVIPIGRVSEKHSMITSAVADKLDRFCWES